MQHKGVLRVALGIALFHLGMVALGAASIDFSEETWLGKILVFYGNFTGAGTGYGFFAPGVTGQIRARFEVIDKDGNKSMTVLEKHQTHEADLRVGNIIDQFLGDANDDKDVQRSLAASLAGTVFGRSPSAREVVVRLESFTPPSMAEYREGKRPEWVPLYSASFIDNKNLVAK
jgi:hypothetical protein